MKIILLLHAGATLYMAGIIWFVQMIHYPLYTRVGSEAFASYQRTHRRLANLTMAPPMIAEVITATLLVFLRPPGVTALQVGLGAVILLIVLLSTFLIQIPRHIRLEGGFDAEIHRHLVATNWIRTIGWSVRGVIALWMVSASMC